MYICLLLESADSKLAENIIAKASCSHAVASFATVSLLPITEEDMYTTYNSNKSDIHTYTYIYMYKYTYIHIYVYILYVVCMYKYKYMNIYKYIYIY